MGDVNKVVVIDGAGRGIDVIGIDRTPGNR